MKLPPKMTDQDDNQESPAARQTVPEDTIGDRIREAREARDWTQKVLSTRTRMADPNKEGISRTVLVGYESGKTKPGAREIRILAAALNVTPNWLLLGNMTPPESVLPSMAFLTRGNELHKAVRMAFAMLVLKQHERDMLGMLLLSLGGRELGDVSLSGLMEVGRMVADEVEANLSAECPELTAALTSPEALTKLIRTIGEGLETNIGNKLRVKDIDNGMWEGEWLYPAPDKPPPPEGT